MLFFRSLFIDVAQNEELNNLKNYIDNNFSINSFEYSPHISLFYGIEGDAIKNEIIRRFKTPKTAIMDKISVVKVDEDPDYHDGTYNYKPGRTTTTRRRIITKTSVKKKDNRNRSMIKKPMTTLMPKRA